MAVLEFAHILWEASKPTIVFTDKSSVTPFFKSKAIPPSLWNACEYLQQLNFRIAQIAGSVNASVDFLSRLEMKVTEKFRLRIREDVQTRPIEVTRSCSDVEDKKKFFFTHRWWKWDRKTNPWKERAISEKGNRMGSTWGAIFNEAKFKRLHKDWQKYYVVLLTGNQGKCMDMKWTRCWDSLENFKTLIIWPTTWRSAINTRQTI